MIEKEKTVVLKYSSMGFGEVIAMEPTIRFLQERGCSVIVEARNPRLASLVRLFGAEFLQKGHTLSVRAAMINVEGKVCSLERSSTAGNRARAHLLCCRTHPEFEDGGYSRPRLHAESTLPMVPDTIKRLAEGKVFVQLYAGEPYKVPTDKWYSAFLDCMSKRGISGFSVVSRDAKSFNFTIPKDFVVIEEKEILKSLSIFQLARAAVVFDSLWLQASGLLGKMALALSGPYTSPGRVEDFKTVKMLPNPCRNSPCWRNREIVCKVSGGLCMCLDPPPELVLDSLVEILEEGPDGEVGNHS